MKKRIVKTYLIFQMLLMLPASIAARVFSIDVFEKSKAVMLLIDPDTGKIEKANNAAVSFYGYSREQLESMTIQQINTFSKAQVAAERRLAAQENRNYFLFRHRLADNSIHRVEVYSHPIQYRDRTLLFSIIQDVTNAELARETIDHYSKNLEELVDKRTTQILKNEQKTRYIITTALVLTLIIIIALLYTIRQRNKSEQELARLNASLEIRINEAIKEIRKKDTIIHEQSKRQALDDMLIDLAHHWRQPLNTASLEIQNIQDHLGPEANKTEVGHLIEVALNELTDLSNTISLFTRFYEQTASEELSIAQGFHKFVELSGRSYHAKGISFETEFDDSFQKKARADEWVDMFSVFARNVSDTVTRRQLGGARVTIKATSGSYAEKIVVSDNAGGIDKTMLPDKLFKPYTTTGFKSHNKGLGLYNVYVIVNYRLSGSIKAENTEAGGRFTITIPKNIEGL